MVRKELFPEDKYARTFLRVPLDGLDVGDSGRATGLQEWSPLGRRDCIAFHALAIHGSGRGRRVSVLESWTSGSMRRLHNKSLQLSPKRPP
jgi:hypothetical protein